MPTKSSKTTKPTTHIRKRDKRKAGRDNDGPSDLETVSSSQAKKRRVTANSKDDDVIEIEDDAPKVVVKRKWPADTSQWVRDQTWAQDLVEKHPHLADDDWHEQNKKILGTAIWLFSLQCSYRHYRVVEGASVG
jgi:hypothetical protein